MRYLVIVLLVVATVHSAKAQYNDTTHYYAGLASTGTFNQTNSSRTFLLSNTFRFGMRQKRCAFNAFNKYLYGHNAETVTNSDLTSAWDFNYYTKHQQLYSWAILTYNRIYSLKVNHQLQVGGGMAYDLIDSQKMQLNVSDGILYDFSDIQIQDTVRDEYQTFRNSFRIQYKITAGNLSFRITSILQNSFEYKSDYIIKADAALAYRFKKWLSLTMQGNYNRMNRTGKETLFITYGLSFEKYF